AVECVTSPDGRIIGRMGHVERTGENLYRNVSGIYTMKFFEAACYYFRKS
ncbi:MAG: phosphoribosylformylglycinamidine synthase subunit PurQ, partial [Synergistaceae bacterium]|nr:phosphoribosylformylglycinamidine synthase subunit PurQ [Synergistaceae bacterium]